MKRYLLFGGDNQPAGGWSDFADTGDNLQSLVDSTHCRDLWSWWHIVDSTTGLIIMKGNHG